MRLTGVCVLLLPPHSPLSCSVAGSRCLLGNGRLPSLPPPARPGQARPCGAPREGAAAGEGGVTGDPVISEGDLRGVGVERGFLPVSSPPFKPGGGGKLGKKKKISLPPFPVCCLLKKDFCVPRGP